MSDKTTARVHELKTWPDYFDAVARGDKTFEVRRDDRGFQCGDTLVLRRWLPETQDYDGPALLLFKRVTYVLNGGQFGIEPGFVVMGLTDAK